VVPALIANFTNCSAVAEEGSSAYSPSSFPRTIPGDSPNEAFLACPDPGRRLRSQAHSGSVVNGPMSFEPIAASACGMEADSSLATDPWVIPERYVQTIVSNETDHNIYVSNDWHGMNAVNETGMDAGR